MNIFNKCVIVKAIFAAVCTANLALAAPLVLPATPLIAGSTVNPNMMLLLDSSGSMNNIVEHEDYIATTDYYNCPTNNTLSNSQKILIAITDNGTVYFKKEGGEYTTFGNSGTARCFADDRDYNASLLANRDLGSYRIPGTGSTLTNANYGSAAYKGNFLNWYFASTNFGAGASRKPGSSTRMEVAREAAKTLIGDLEDIRVGIAEFTGSDGAKIIANLADVETQETALKTAITSINALGGTPLAESLQDLGWYFTKGAAGNLTLHEGEETEESCAAQTIFDYSINHSSDTITSSSAVMQYWCQQNFIVAMTDGLPSVDDGISSKLKNYSTAENAVNVVKAMYETDLRPDLKNGTTQVKNHVSSYLIGFADAKLGNSTLMTSMAQQGTGGDGTLLTASNSSELISAFSSAIQSIFEKVAARSAVSFNTSKLSSDSALYQADFNTAGWQGSLKAFELSDTGDVASDATWDAGAKLDAISFTERNLFSYNPVTKKGVEFTRASLTASQLDDLRKGPEGTTTANVDNLINYISGDRSLEGSDATSYRTRSSRLGDIVNSASVYVGAPQLNWPDFGTSGTDYSAFKVAKAGRTPMLYVGANDGMLHGFNAEITGADAGLEMFAYIPSTIFSTEDDAGLHYLADKDYAHRFYVDLTPTVSDVYINSAWRTVLIGGLRSGGKGLFALDITNPTDFTGSSANAEKLALWEFSSADDPDFGYSYSKPTVAMMENDKWAVIVGNGYNSTNEHAKLFILFIEEGADGTWSVDDYKKIDTGRSTGNGLSTPTVVDTDNNGKADRIYAGDLQGNMWAFDVSGGNTNQWGVAYTSGNTAKPLFTALNGSDEVQPITSAPTVTRNPHSAPTNSNEPNLLVSFGTGQYLEGTDIASNLKVMSYYSVLDANAGDKARTDLTSRTILTNGDLRAVKGDAVPWSTSSGWYIDLVDRAKEADSGSELGERVVADSVVRNNILFFNTIIPSGSACASGGTSWLMSVDLTTGLAPAHAVFDANNNGSITTSSTAATTDNDLNDDGVVDGGDTGYVGEKINTGLASQSAILGNIQNTVTSTGTLAQRKVNAGNGDQDGRLSWEEQIR